MITAKQNYNEDGHLKKEDALRSIQASLCGLLIDNPDYKEKPLSWVNTHFAPAIRHHQIRFLKNKNNNVTGFITWAFLSDIVEARLISGGIDIQPDEWNCGDRLWIIDKIASDQHAQKQLNLIEKELFGKNPTQHILEVNKKTKINFDPILATYYDEHHVIEKGKGKQFKVRLAKNNKDVDKLLDLLDDYINETPTELLAPDREHIKTIWRGFMQNKQQQFAPMLAEKDDKVIGFLLGKIGQYNNTNILAAQNVGFYVHPDYRGTRAALMLVGAYKRWAEFSGARLLIMSVMSGIDLAKTDRFFKKTGFNLAGGNYQMILSPKGSYH